uniref:Cysteine-rich protein n=1 Tax=Spironucleus salmonicida TaxID=348837 RepID=V6LMC2_9EUKA|eukprot:EST45842.1 Cysteine-rich protein [Spironucleus salmonicida]
MQRRHLRRRCCSVPGVRSRVRVEGRACQACAQGFYKSGDACYPCGLTCKSCRSGLDCDVCTDFYARNDDGICMPGTGCQVAKDCGPGHFCGQTKTCAKCMGSGKECQNDDSCDVCDSGLDETKDCQERRPGGLTIVENTTSATPTAQCAKQLQDAAQLATSPMKQRQSKRACRDARISRTA